MVTTSLMNLVMTIYIALPLKLEIYVIRDKLATNVVNMRAYEGLSEHVFQLVIRIGSFMDD